MARFIGSLCGGVCVALLLFIFMNGMISGDRSGYSGADATRLVDFIRVADDETTRTKDRQVPKKPPPPKQPPPPPDLQVSQEVRPNVPQMNINMPRIDVPFGAGTGPYLGNYGAMATEGDLIPMVQIQPEWPRQALLEGVSGWVRLRFTVNEDGTVSSPAVVESSHRMFERPALRAILRWKFKPRIVDGRPVKRDATLAIEFNIDEAASR